MKEMTINELQKKYNKYSKRAKRAYKFASFVGLKGWSPESKWVSDSDSRNPIMYIPDAIKYSFLREAKYSILKNIFISPFILLFSGFPRAAMYSIASAIEGRNLRKAHIYSERREKLMKLEDDRQNDPSISERAKVVENKRKEKSAKNVKESKTTETATQEAELEHVEEKEEAQSDNIQSSENKQDMVMGE